MLQGWQPQMSCMKLQLCQADRLDSTRRDGAGGENMQPPFSCQFEQLTCVISAEPTQMTTTAKIKRSPNLYFQDAPLFDEPAAVIVGASHGDSRRVRTPAARESESTLLLFGLR